ncbi:MAG TPA: rhomboid-like protein [Mycobacterium sp.]|nr:rhomboid-like protein [Mycobacterium sp.]
MVTRTLSTLLRLRLTVGYAGALVAVATTLLMLGPRVQEHVIRHMSTNLHNLEHGQLGTLIGSAFVTENGPIWVWLPGLVCLLALAELLWRSGRVLITFALGHVGATLIVAAGLAATIKLGWIPISVAHDSDVGISYGAVAVLGALTAAIPSRSRPAWIGWWFSVALLALCANADFTDGGHFVALLVGILLSFRLGAVTRWTRVRLALLVVGVAFGYLVLVNTGLPVAVAPVVGTVGALTAHWLAGRWQARRTRPARAAAAALTTDGAGQQPTRAGQTGPKDAGSDVHAAPGG